MLFTGIDFLINLNGCLSVFKKKKEGKLAEAGMELMVNKIANLFLTSKLDPNWRAQICATNNIFGIFGNIWHIWARN